MSDAPVVHVVDDDDAVRTALARLLQSAGLNVTASASAEEFLSRFNADQPGCLVLDIRMPGASGLDVQARLATLRPQFPIVMISGHADVTSAIKAMRAGAVDFLPKPYDPKVLLERVKQCLLLDAERRKAEATRSAALAAFEKLSPRERQVMERMSQGSSSKDIAAELGISRKTIDIHRAHVMSKLGVESMAELVRFHMLLHGRESPIPPPTLP